MANNQRILFVVSNHQELGNTGKKTGYYLPEAAHPHEVLSNAGYQIDFVSPKGGLSPCDESSIENFKSDEICQKFLKNETIQKQLSNTLKPSDVAPLDYVAIFFVGGHGPMFDMPDNTEIQQLTAKIYEANNTNIVAAVCHGPIGLVNVKLSSGEYLVKDKEVTGFSNSEEEAVKLVEQMPCLLEDKMKERGAKYSAAANWAANVKVDGRVVTGQNPASATPIGEEIVKLLKQQ